MSARILLAEDDDETAGFVERGLRELGHVVTRVADGEYALHLGVTDPYEVVILDRLLPRMDGLEVLRRWRAAAIRTPSCC